MYCPPETAVFLGLMGIKLEETISMMREIKQIA